jgi:hypothetical protein
MVMTSPTVPVIGGQGQAPLIPTTGLENPSGAALTHVVAQLKVWSADMTWQRARAKTARKSPNMAKIQGRMINEDEVKILLEQ